jgi:hypothetical protein
MMGTRCPYYRDYVELLLFSIRGSGLGRSGLHSHTPGTHIWTRDTMSRDARPLIQFKVRVKQAQLASLPKPPSPSRHPHQISHGP